MKRYIFGMIAVVIAIGAAAFTAPKKHLVDMYVFEYDGSQGYTVGAVQNTNSAHWVYQGKNLALCANSNIKACRVSVTGDYVDNTTSPTQLSGVTITAVQSSTGIAYVDDITDDSDNQFSNKP